MYVWVFFPFVFCPFGMEEEEEREGRAITSIHLTPTEPPHTLVHPMSSIRKNLSSSKLMCSPRGEGLSAIRGFVGNRDGGGGEERKPAGEEDCGEDVFGDEEDEHVNLNCFLGDKYQTIKVCICVSWVGSAFHAITLCPSATVTLMATSPFGIGHRWPRMIHSKM